MQTKFSGRYLYPRQPDINMAGEESCIRCLVHLELIRISWPQDNSSLTLKGHPVFVRICFLGQLQQTDIFPPTFPILINDTLSFDRIFTNCHLPSLLPEVLRGEHLKIELVQINKNYTGGKILGRYETSATNFLFGNERRCGQFQLVMDKSHRYKTSPLLLLSCNMTLSEAVVKSAVKILGQPTSVDPAEQLEATLDSTHQRLQKALEKNNDKLLSHDLRSSDQSPDRPPTFAKPGNLSRSHDRSRDRSQEQSSLLGNSTTLNFTSDHSWKACPRRTGLKPKSVSNGNQATPLKPFVVGKPDPLIISKRDFCTCSPYKDTSKAPSTTGGMSDRGGGPIFSSTPKGDQSLYSKYLGNRGNQRLPTSKLVCEKLDDLIDEISHKQDSYSLTDEETRNTGHIKRSLFNEIDNSFNNTQYTNDSLLTKIGPTDYWSKKLADYSGKKHRIVFDETLEKIYKRLYDTSNT